MEITATCVNVNSSVNGSAVQFSVPGDPAKDASGKDVPTRPKVIITAAFSDNNEALKFQTGKQYAVSIQ